MLETLAGVVVGAAIGFAGTHILEVRRERRQSEGDRKLMAGALSAELMGTVEDWRVLMAGHKERPEQINLIASDEPFFSVYDGAGYRLTLLPQTLANETVACYLKAKGIVDLLRMEGRLFSHLPLVPKGERPELQEVLKQRCGKLIGLMDDALPVMEEVAGKLRAVDGDS